MLGSNQTMNFAGEFQRILSNCFWLASLSLLLVAIHLSSCRWKNERKTTCSHDIKLSFFLIIGVVRIYLRVFIFTTHDCEPSSAGFFLKETSRYHYAASHRNREKRVAWLHWGSPRVKDSWSKRQLSKKLPGRIGYDGERYARGLMNEWLAFVPIHSKDERGR